MKKILMSVWIALILLTGGSEFALADGINVNLTVKNNGDVVYSGNIPLLGAGTISINDSSGSPHDTKADSVLSIVNTADTLSGDFNISNLIYYDMFGAFYLKCINVSGSDLCDNWQYKVNNVSPSVGMDSEILSGGENVVLYFGDENKIPEPEPETPSTHSNSGGSGYIILNTICEQGQKFSITTGQPCTSFILSPLLVYPTLTPPSSSNTTFEEEGGDILPANPKEQPKKINKIKDKNTTSIANSVPSVPAQNETTKNTWWRRFWDKIFSIF
ncbi:MAG: hypothetical protein WCW93_00475 [Candidatus Paceibacterota bacterium]